MTKEEEAYHYHHLCLIRLSKASMYRYVMSFHNYLSSINLNMKETRNNKEIVRKKNNNINNNKTNDFQNVKF